MKLLHKLLLPYILIIGLFYFSFLFISGNLIASTAEPAIRRSAGQTFDIAETTVSTMLMSAVEITDSIMFNPEVGRMLTQDPGAMSLAEQLGDRRRLSDIVASSHIRGGSSYATRFHINGDFAYADNAGSFMSRDIIRAMDWYGSLAARNYKVLWLNSDNDTVPSATYGSIAAMRVILNPYNYLDTIGYLQVDIPKKDIEDILTRAAGTQDSVAYIVDRTGRKIVSSGGGDGIGEIDMRSMLALLVNGEYHRTYPPGGPDYFLACKVIPNTGCYLVSITSMREILHPINALRTNILLIGIIASPVLFLSAFMISRSITKRIKKLSQALRSVLDGDFGISLPLDSNDEIGELIGSFNYMTDKLSTMIGEQYELGVQAQKSEFLALQSQINPHFLYNTLDMIHWAAIEKGSKEISDTVVALSRFYRLSLSDGASFIKIREEIEHVRLYLDVMRLRFDNVFSYSFDLEPDILECIVVKIILQPIAENAIIHGILQKNPKEGNIRISASRDGADIVLAISDDGVGIPKDKLERLLSDAETGYGVRSTDRRIKLYYGSRYGITCHSTVGAGTTMEIRIPCLTDSQAHKDIYRRGGGKTPESN